MFCGGEVDHDLAADHIHEGGDRIEKDVRSMPLSCSRVALTETLRQLTQLVVRKPRKIGCSTVKAKPRG